MRIRLVHLGRTLVLAALLAAVGALVSCGGGRKTCVFYAGEQRPANQVAIIEIGSSSLFVMAIDTMRHTYAALEFAAYEVLPGLRKLSVKYKSWKGTSSEALELEFVAAAGHRYVVDAGAGYKQWTAWITDKATDSVVVGRKP